MKNILQNILRETDCFMFSKNIESCPSVGESNKHRLKRRNNISQDQIVERAHLQKRLKIRKTEDNRVAMDSNSTMAFDHHYDSTTSDYYDSCSSISLSDNETETEQQPPTTTSKRLAGDIRRRPSWTSVYFSRSPMKKKHNSYDCLTSLLVASNIESSQSSKPISTQGTDPLTITSAGNAAQSQQTLQPSLTENVFLSVQDAKILWDDLEPQTCPQDLSPDMYLRNIFAKILGVEPKTKLTTELIGQFFPKIDEDCFANYNLDVVTAVRENNLENLKNIHKSGQSLRCCNRYGESLLHMACRRGFHSIVSFLINEAKVSLRIADDCGRNPLHDALWHRDTQYHIVDLLTRLEPALLLASDNRGYTPFSYCRQEHWSVWRQFLWDRKEHMAAALEKNKSLIKELFQ